MNEPESNPYQPPKDIRSSSDQTTDVSALHESPYVKSTLGQTTGRWFLVCGISAVPSFIFGFTASDGEVMAMLLGIAIFAVGYTLLDFRTADLGWRKNKLIRRTLRFTYGTRIAISILIPLGGYLDVICGLLSMQISGFMIGDVALDSLGDGGLGFLPALVLTLTQGLVMNGVLAVYGGLILGINGIVAVLRK